MFIIFIQLLFYCLPIQKETPQLNEAEGIEYKPVPTTEAYPTKADIVCINKLWQQPIDILREGV